MKCHVYHLKKQPLISLRVQQFHDTMHYCSSLLVLSSLCQFWHFFEASYSAFQLIISRGRSRRPSEGSPRPPAKFFHYNYLTYSVIFIHHLSGQEALFVRSLTQDPSPICNTVITFRCICFLKTGPLQISIATQGGVCYNSASILKCK